MPFGATFMCNHVLCHCNQKTKRNEQKRRPKQLFFYLGARINKGYKRKNNKRKNDFGKN